MPLQPDRSRTIEELISVRTFDALKQCKLIKRTSELQPTVGEGVRRETKTFAERLVLMEHGKDWGTPGFIPLRQALDLPIFYLVSTKDIITGEDKLYGYPSWLYFGKRKGHYAVVFDEESIDNKCLDIERSQLFRLYLFYHELGHMVLHRTDLWNRKIMHDPKWSQGGRASQEMELEADLAARILADRCGRIQFPQEFFYQETQPSG